jgi:hypothetical protein
MVIAVLTWHRTSARRQDARVEAARRQLEDARRRVGRSEIAAARTRKLVEDNSFGATIFGAAEILHDNH